MTNRTLPDPDLSYRDACDFIFSSELAKKAFSDPSPAYLSNFVRELVFIIYKLSISCHLAEFTDHGLSHLCSLVDRASRWTSNVGEKGLVCKDHISSADAGVLLVAILIHDIGMLSQRPEDMPDSDNGVSHTMEGDIPTWVRKTHVDRLRKLTKRLIDETSYRDYIGSDSFQRSLSVAEAHASWPWEWEKFKFSQVDGGLAAILAVCDLLDEDAGRCDSMTLLKHRYGSTHSCAHWMRHGLTARRIQIDKGVINVELGRPPDTDAQLNPVFDALRNHYRLSLLYNSCLRGVGAGIVLVKFGDAEEGTPEVESQVLKGWEEIAGFNNQEALIFHLVDSFMPHALMDKRRLNSKVLAKLVSCGLKEIDLSYYVRIKGSLHPRTEIECDFQAVLG